MTGADGAAPGSAGVVGFHPPRRIRLVPLEPELPDEGVVNWLAADLADRLGTGVVVGQPFVPAPGWRTSDGAQLDSGAIVDTLIDRLPLPETGGVGEWVLAVTAADLRGGGRDYVFGEAAMGGAWAVIGTARLGAPGEQVFRTRVLTEALHELGHLAGLDHCPDADCLMAPSRTVQEIDRKRHALCNACRIRAGVEGP